MRVLLLLLTVATAACAGQSAPRSPPAPALRFSVQRFFDGRTHGDGELKIALSKRKHTVVEGRGRLEADGTLVLDQTVTQGSEVPTHREWRIREISAGHYAGTLTDASGPVRGDVDGNRLHLHFAMKVGLIADQWLDLAADSRSAHNRMVISKLGLVVARLNETISKVG